MDCVACPVTGCSSCNPDGTCATCADINQKPNEAGTACV